jgi:hypothetical protein
MAILGEFGRVCGHFEQGAARACNGASQHVYEHPWGAKPHTCAILLLPRFITDLFKYDGVAHGDYLMDKPPMQAATRCAASLRSIAAFLRRVFW